MKLRNLLFLILLLPAITSKADWFPFPLYQYSYYKTPDYYKSDIALYVINVDTMIGDSGNTTYKFRQNLPFPGVSNCNTISKLSLDIRFFHPFSYIKYHYLDSIIVQQDTFWLHLHDEYVSMLFKPWSDSGDSWISEIRYRGSLIRKIRFTCKGIFPESILSVPDSVKVFEIEVLNENDQPISSPLNAATFKLSKSFGFSQFISYSNLVADKVEYMNLVGFENDSIQAGFTALDFSDFITLKPGDLLFWRYERHIVDPTQYEHSFTYYKDSITQVTKDSLAIKVFFKRIYNDKEFKMDSVIYKRNTYEPLLQAPDHWFIDDSFYWLLLTKTYWYYDTSQIKNQIIEYKKEGYIISSPPCHFGQVTDTDDYFTFSTNLGTTETIIFGHAAKFHTTLIGSVIDGKHNGHTGLSENYPPAAPNPLRIYPNPATERLTLENLPVHDGPCHVELYNTRGQLILQKTVNSNSAELDLLFLERGVYLLKINSANNIHVEKVVVQRSR
ncbi:MAG: T9SS type A sorting domain-containing protein [Bacteroidia bacterium]